MNPDAASLVLGGGLAGSMVALELARNGRSVVLVEKSKGPHDKVCGEFLSQESLLYLERHKVDLLALGGVPIHSLRFITRCFARETELPFAAFSLSRKTLDEELLGRAASAGVEVYRGAFVESLQKQHGSWSAHLRDGQSLQSVNVFMATGKHDLRGWARPPGTHGNLVGFKMYFRLTGQQLRELGHAIELILFPGGYAGLQPVENGTANLCLLVNTQSLRDAGSNWTSLLQVILEHSPHLAKRLEGAMPLLDTPLAASNIPYGHMQRDTQDGLWRLGDQAAVIPSFCGDGMAIALHSGALAASCYLQGETSGVYQRRLHQQLAQRLWMATKLSHLLVSFPQATHLVRLFPGLLPGIASMTRIPDEVLIRGVLHGD